MRKRKKNIARDHNRLNDFEEKWKALLDGSGDVTFFFFLQASNVTGYRTVAIMSKLSNS